MHSSARSIGQRSGCLFKSSCHFFTFRDHRCGTMSMWLKCHKKESQDRFFKASKPEGDLEVDQEGDGCIISIISFGHT